MRILYEEEKMEAIVYLGIAIQEADCSTCLRHHCGCVIVKEDEIIGEGFNSPPGNLESQRRCLVQKDTLDKKVTDKTCCVHAEERAIINALKNNGNKIEGSRLYFMRVDKEGRMTKAGMPYCTLCSKMALDAGISEFVLWHEEGITVYDIEEYNRLSFKYKGK